MKDLERLTGLYDLEEISDEAEELLEAKGGVVIATTPTVNCPE